jgi:thiol-disulfide isomerase/thioredoxin
MLSVNVGPLGLSVDRLAFVFAFLAALAVGWLVGRRRSVGRGEGVGAVLPDMLLVGLLVGRVAFVARWFESYRDQPWSMLDIRDGGFDVWAGLAAALLLAAWRGWRRPTLRVPLAAGLAAGALAWGGLTVGVYQIRESMPSVPDTTLHSMAGESTRLAALAQGRPMVVNLWATWCAPCVREMPVLAAAQQRERGIVFVFVNQSEGATRVERFMTAHELVLDNMLLDPGGELARAVGSRAMPTTLFYDAQGRLVDTHLGAVSSASLAAKLERIRPLASR